MTHSGWLVLNARGTHNLPVLSHLSSRHHGSFVEASMVGGAQLCHTSLLLVAMATSCQSDHISPWGERRKERESEWVRGREKRVEWRREMGGVGGGRGEGERKDSFIPH